MGTDGRPPRNFRKLGRFPFLMVEHATANADAASFLQYHIVGKW